MKGFVLPYTYLIGWSSHHIYYYGCRYSKSSTPDDLWVSYFSSSKAVSQIRQLIGEPDIVQVRRVFESKDQAIQWEHKVLRRLQVVSRSDFLNKHDGMAPPINRMFGTMNPQTRPEWFSIKSERGKQRAKQMLARGTNIMGRPLAPPVIRICPTCGNQKTYRTYKLKDVEVIKTRQCKSCSGTKRNLERAAAGFYDRIKGPRKKNTTT